MQGDDREKLGKAADRWLAERVGEPPDGLVIAERHEAAALVVEITPPRRPAYPILLFALAWDAVVVGLYARGLRSGEHPALLFVLAHVAAGAFVSYQALVRLVNRASVRIGTERVVVSQGPIPTRDGPSTPLEDVERFEPGEMRQGWVIVGTFGMAASAGGWDVHAILKSGRAVELGLQLPEPAHAEFVARRLDAALAAVRAHRTYRG